MKYSECSRTVWARVNTTVTRDNGTEHKVCGGNEKAMAWRRWLTCLAEPFPTASPAAHNNSGKSKQRPSYSNSAAPLFPPHMAGLHSILHYIVITLHGEVSLFWRQRFTTGSRRLGSNRDYPCVHCTSHVIGSAISSHSEHRFPAPSSKEGCRNRCLEFAISSVKAGHGT